jgi:hypothetical protein
MSERQAANFFCESIRSGRVYGQQNLNTNDKIKCLNNFFIREACRHPQEEIIWAGLGGEFFNHKLNRDRPGRVTPKAILW